MRQRVPRGSLPVPPLVLGFGQIDPTQQQRKLFVTQDDLALRITGLRPGETPFLQPLGTDPESASVPDEDLQPIALAVAEQEQVPAQRLTRQSIADQTVQPLEPLAHVGDPGGQIDPCGWAQSKHGLRPLQSTHQALERTRIKIRMHLDPAPARQHHGQPTTRFVLLSAISWPPTPPAPTDRPKKLALRLLFQRRFFRWRSSVLKLKPRLWQNSLRRIPLLTNSATNC